jgi:hypothetical protein
MKSITHYHETRSLLEQIKDALRKPEGGLVVNVWRSVQIVQNGQTAQVEVFCPSNPKAGIRLRRPVKLLSGQYYEIMRFNRKGELVSGPLVKGEL